VGAGTTFWIEIPLQRISARAVSDDYQPGQLPTGSEPTSSTMPPLAGHILVAEDNPVNQLYIGELLQNLGCTRTIVGNGEEALDRIGNEAFDLILMDCQMPELDGYSASREIRRREATDPQGQRVPIIALTANALKGAREMCLEAGMDEYLGKPIAMGQLVDVLRKFLDSP